MYDIKDFHTYNTNFFLSVLYVDITIASIPKLKNVKNGKILKTKLLKYFADTNISPKLVLSKNQTK